MRPIISFAVVALTATLATPAFAESSCPKCPQVELSQDGVELRVESEDDQDPAESLRHRLRLRTGQTASAWSKWSPATDYEIAPGARGVIETQTLDSDGYVGIAAIEWVDPTREPIGPGERRESGGTDSSWDIDAFEPGAAMTEEIPAPVRPSTDQFADFDHGECPTSSDATCAAAAGDRPGSAWAIGALLLGMIGLRRRH